MRRHEAFAINDPLAVVMSGCSSAPTEQEIDAADFGLSMSEETCLAVATPFITQRMGDPESSFLKILSVIGAGGSCSGCPC